MDEISPLIALPFKLGNLIIEESVFATCVDIVGIELIANTTKTLFSEPSMTKVNLENRLSSSVLPQNGVAFKVESNHDKPRDCSEDNNSLLRTRSLIFSPSINHELNGDDPTKSELWASLEESGEAKRTSIVEVSEEIKINKPIIPSNLPPLWGLTSIRGRRTEMEDSAVALPQFLKIPSFMLRESLVASSVNQDSTAHLFGVYDGHGGHQVADYCREHLHLALAEEIGIAKEESNVEIEHDLKEKWLDIFQRCFHRLDDEVGGFPGVVADIASNPPSHLPIAPESVGSTAVVAIVSLTHIIVANCGDSRAVLNRGRCPFPYPWIIREDECARIEAAGGKVINWDGYRVSGVLAVSRSIGDRYLRPYIVSDPEITFVPRMKEDECVILASDGLWDVMTNEEACDLARKRILLWHKKNGTNVPKDRGSGVDPAAQDAANYLSQLAFQRGSADNISVIVVDLKAQRKFKKKS